MNTTSNTDKKIGELELALSKMKQQNDVLQKKLKEEADKKLKIEKDLEKEQQKLKDLEMRTDQQQKILKKKTEDLVTAQRKLRSGSNAGLPTDSENKHWIEQEMERILNEKQQLEIYKEELQKREDLIKKKEILLKEKNELEMKKLRSSQMTRENLVLVDQKLDSLNKQIMGDKSKDTSVKDLQDTHASLIKQRKQLEERLNQGVVLSSAEERRLIEIDEGIEALEIAIDFENDSISEQHNKLKDSIFLSNESDDPDEVISLIYKLLIG